MRPKLPRYGKTRPLGRAAWGKYRASLRRANGTPAAMQLLEVFNMTRAVLSGAIDSDWRLVSQARPCPVCGAEDTCGVHTVDDFACCARAPSEWKLTNGSWLHRLQAPSEALSAPAHLSPVANTNGSRF